MIEITNQPPPLENYNLLSSDTVLGDAVAAGKCSLGVDGSARRLVTRLGTAETIAAGCRRQSQHARFEIIRPLRSQDRRGRISRQLAQTTGPRAGGWSAYQAMGRAAKGRPRCSRGWCLHAGPDRERRLLPCLDDLRVGRDVQACASDCRRAGCRASIRAPTIQVFDRLSKKLRR